MPNELGWTDTGRVSRINATTALFVVDIQNMPANLLVDALVINRQAVGDTVIDVLCIQSFPPKTQFPYSFIDYGKVIVPGGGGTTVDKPIDPTKSYVYSAGVTSYPVVYQEWAQDTLPPATSAAPKGGGKNTKK